MLKQINNTNKGTWVARVIVGTIFLSEGIQKFVTPAATGAGRFEKIGFVHPEFWASLTGSLEIICGLLLLAGILIRLASVPLLAIMIVAFFATKVPVLTEKGFWSFAHEFRTDFAMTVLLCYLLFQKDTNELPGYKERTGV